MSKHVKEFQQRRSAYAGFESIHQAVMHANLCAFPLFESVNPKGAQILKALVRDHIEQSYPRENDPARVFIEAYITFIEAVEAGSCD